MKAAIVGIAGTELSDDEAALFRAQVPAGIVLFARNVRDPAQLRCLTQSLRTVLPPGAVLMIDQEGGRVARLRPPFWREHPPAAMLGGLHAAHPKDGRRAAWLTGALVGLDCAAAGFDVVCAPVLDLRVQGAHDVIGDRAFSDDPAAVARLGRSFAEGLLAAGMQPVAKHAPGHGRAGADSHLELPRVAADQAMDADIRPFAMCADLPWMMTAHILYAGWDAMRPATLSPMVVARVIRQQIGFGGMLVSDDLAMHALEGSPGSLAQQALAAGCDVALHCTGRLEDTEDVLGVCPDLADPSRRRLDRARAMAERSRVPLDANALATERARLLA